MYHITECKDLLAFKIYCKLDFHSLIGNLAFYFCPFNPSTNIYLIHLKFPRFVVISFL